MHVTFKSRSLHSGRNIKLSFYPQSPKYSNVNIWVLFVVEGENENTKITTDNLGKLHDIGEHAVKISETWFGSENDQCLQYNALLYYGIRGKDDYLPMSHIY